MSKNGDIANKLKDAFNASFSFNVPESPIPNTFDNIDFRDPDKVTNDILAFLRSQNETASKQFKTSRNLIIATIVIMILQIVIAGFGIAQSNKEQNDLKKVIELQSQQSESISRMSLSLLDLQNQVRLLEKENAKLKIK